MSNRRLCSGSYVLVSPSGEVFDGIFAILRETAKAMAEERLGRKWEDLEADHYELVPTDVWSL